MTFTTPLRDMRFALDHMAGFGALEKSGGFPELSDDLVSAILEEMGKYCDQVVAPLNEISDAQGRGSRKRCGKGNAGLSRKPTANMSKLAGARLPSLKIMVGRACRKRWPWPWSMR